MKGKTTIVPASLQSKALNQLPMNHKGIEKTRLLSCECICWINMNADIEDIAITALHVLITRQHCPRTKLSLYVPYPMTWDFHSSLSLAFSNSATYWYLTPLSPIHSFKFAIQSDCFLHLLLFPSIFPVNARFSKPSFLIKCPKNLICFVLISKISFMPVPALFKTSPFLTLSVQGILTIYLKNHISQLSKCFLISDVINQVSLPYNSTR